LRHHRAIARVHAIAHYQVIDLARTKHRHASSCDATIGSESLNEVLISIGTPVFLRNPSSRLRETAALRALRLDTAGFVDVDDARDLRPHRVFHFEDRLHRRAEERVLEPLILVLVHHAGCERRNHSRCSALVQAFLHIGRARIGENAAIAQRARAKFHAAAEQADDFFLRELLDEPLDEARVAAKFFGAIFESRLVVAGNDVSPESRPSRPSGRLRATL